MTVALGCTNGLKKRDGVAVQRALLSEFMRSSNRSCDRGAQNYPSWGLWRRSVANGIRNAFRLLETSSCGDVEGFKQNMLPSGAMLTLAFCFFPATLTSVFEVRRTHSSDRIQSCVQGGTPWALEPSFEYTR
jgi:hypothetical protein